MRTTLTIDDGLLAAAKMRAAVTNRTLAATIEDALRLAFGARLARSANRVITIPTSGSGGLQPGVDLDDTAELMDRMEGRA